MARKRRGLLEDVVEVVAMLPWWVGIVLALLTYVGLSHLAAQPIPSTLQPGQLGVAIGGSFWRALASVGQYLIPLLCLLGSGVSAWRRRERAQLVAVAVRNEPANVIDGLTWAQFERLVGEGFRLQGYRVLESGGGGPDGGVDLVLSKDGEKYLVQCKQWRAFKVGVEVVRELYGVMAAKGVAGGFVVTSGRFTEEAQAFARGRNVKLIDGPLLGALLKQAAGVQRRGVDQDTGGAAATVNPASSPSCPLCGKSMVLRTAKRGSNAGNQFWGCSGYPVCKGTRGG